MMLGCCCLHFVVVVVVFVEDDHDDVSSLLLLLNVLISELEAYLYSFVAIVLCCNSTTVNGPSRR